MNTDQTLSIIRSLLKLIGGALLAHGATKAAGIVNGEDTAGLILAIVGFITSHITHGAPAPDADGARGAARPTSGPIVLVGLLMLGLGLTACSTSQTTTAYKAETAANISVSAAMTAWGAYVTAKHPDAATEEKVWKAWAAYKQAELASIDATTALANSPTNTAPVAAASQALAAAGADLISLIQTFGITIAAK